MGRRRRGCPWCRRRHPGLWRTRTCCGTRQKGRRRRRVTLSSIGNSPIPIGEFLFSTGRDIQQIWRGQMILVTFLVNGHNRELRFSRSTAVTFLGEKRLSNYRVPHPTLKSGKFYSRGVL